MGIVVTDSHASIPLVLRKYDVTGMTANADNAVPHDLGYLPHFAFAVAVTAGSKAGITVLSMTALVVNLGVPTGVTSCTLYCG